MGRSHASDDEYSERSSRSSRSQYIGDNEPRDRSEYEEKKKKKRSLGSRIKDKIASVFNSRKQEVEVKQEEWQRTENERQKRAADRIISLAESREDGWQWPDFAQAVEQAHYIDLARMSEEERAARDASDEDWRLNEIGRRLAFARDVHLEMEFRRQEAKARRAKMLADIEQERLDFEAGGAAREARWKKQAEELREHGWTDEIRSRVNAQFDEMRFLSMARWKAQQRRMAHAAASEAERTYILDSDDAAAFEAEQAKKSHSRGYDMGEIADSFSRMLN